MARSEDQAPTRDSRDHGLESEVVLARARARLLGTQTPNIVGRYRVLEKLGSGGMGVVYAALDDELDRRIAIKILRGDIAETNSGRQRLIREAQAMAKLSHPNVAHVYEVGHHRGRVFVAMEHIAGSTLRQWVKDADRTVTEILAMHLQAGEGLAAAHEAGIIHRDYKPDNVLVGPDGRPRVLDFGLARPDCEASTLTNLDQVDSGGHESFESSDLTVTGTVLGTPAYMAPEQLDGGTVDARADQFAFCVALFEALYGQRPFAGGTLTQLAVSTSTGRPKRIDPRRHRVPRRVHAALMRGLSSNRDHRFPTMRLLLDELTDARHARPRRLAIVGSVFALAMGGAAALATTRAPAIVTDPVDQAAQAHAELLASSDLPEPQPDPLAGDPTGVTIHRLDNGLTVYLAPRPGEPQIEAQIVIRADASDETTPGVSSLATRLTMTGSREIGTIDFELERPHFDKQVQLLGLLPQTEDPQARLDLIARADAAYQASAELVIPDEVSRVGGELGFAGGAIESHHVSIFSSTIPPNRLAAWAELYAEPLRAPIYRGFTAIAAEDAEMSRELAEDSIAYDAARELLGPTDGVHATFTTAYHAIRQMPYQEVVDFYETYYRPNNAAVVLVGDVTAEEALPVLQRAFGAWEPAPLPEKTHVDRPLPKSPVSIEVSDPNPPAVLLALRLPPENRGDRHRFEALSDALSGPDGLLATALVPDGTATFADAFTEGRTLWAIAYAPPGVDPDELEPKVHAALEAIAAGDVPESAWRSAIARQRLASARWAASPTVLADLIARSFARRRSWGDVVDGLREIATPATLQETAKELIERGFVSVRAKEGPPHRLHAPALPTSPILRKPAARRSPFARRLLAKPAAELEPQFIAQGRDYAQYQYGEGSILIAPDDSPLFRASWTWPVGVDQEPLVCDAIRAKVASRYAWPGLRGLELQPRCATSHVSIDVLGVDEALEDVWPSLSAFLADPEIPFDVAAAHLRQTLAARQGSRTHPQSTFEALHVLAMRGHHGMDAKLPPDEAIPQIPPTDLSVALGRALAVDADVSYVGPRGELFLSGLPDAKGVAGERSPAKFRELERTTVFVLHDPGRPNVGIRVSARVPEVPKARILSELFEHFVFAAPHEMGDVAGLSVAPLGQSRWHPTQRRAHHFEIKAEIPDAARGVELGLALLRRPRDRASFKHAHARAETSYRAARVAPRDIPRALGSRNFADWLALAALEFEDFDAYADALSRAPFTITVVADLSAVDKDVFADFGEVVEVTPDELLRDPELSDRDVLATGRRCECREE